MWLVLLNGKSLGMIETNFAWADPYWRSRCKAGSRYRLVEVTGLDHASRDLKWITA